METVLWLKLLLILFLILGNAYFVGAEVAITGARRSKIRNLAEQGNRAAARVQRLHQEPERFYSVTQIGITLVSLALGALGMDTLAQIMEPWFTALFGLFSSSNDLAQLAKLINYLVAFAIISFLHVVGGELAPKILAFHRAEPMAMAVAWSVDMQYYFWTPVIWAMKHASNFLLWCVGQGSLVGAHGEHFNMTHEEIRTIITASEDAGIFNPEDSKMIHSVMDFGGRTVRTAMVPRTDILAFTRETTLAQALTKFREAPHARYPVYAGNLDNITGYVAMKELLGALADTRENQNLDQTIAEYVNPVYIVPNSKMMSDLLKEFKSTRQQMAVVIDEYGGTEGIITLEDILEQIVGEYEDEFTTNTRRFRKLDDGRFMIDASMRMMELESLLNYEFPHDTDFVTIGGLIYQSLGHIPKMNETITIESAELKVVGMDNHRITMVEFRHIEKVLPTVTESAQPHHQPNEEENIK
ncbi:hemolysin family protein [Candidatus Magnetaquicoccus inordinatus]|uniref:hemolysin family protein n=1 Tax=Candidatus Magnetaquicoccus inordinatus TaxID=2496818 RepID=UPI00102C8D59|nr:hemolysin family protein [Candidatus Magnetaquicoccus inordinatus]